MCIGMLRAVEYVFRNVTAVECVSGCYSCGVRFRMTQQWSVLQAVTVVECVSGCYSCGVCFRMT